MSEQEGIVVFDFEHNGIPYEVEIYSKPSDVYNADSDMDYWGYDEVLEVYPEYPAISNQEILRHFHVWKETNEEIIAHVNR